MTASPDLNRALNLNHKYPARFGLPRMRRRGNGVNQSIGDVVRTHQLQLVLGDDRFGQLHGVMLLRRIRARQRPLHLGYGDVVATGASGSHLAQDRLPQRLQHVVDAVLTDE